MVLWLSYVLKPNIVTVWVKAVVQVGSKSKTHFMREDTCTYIQIGGMHLEQIMRFGDTHRLSNSEHCYQKEKLGEGHSYRFNNN